METLDTNQPAEIVEAAPAVDTVEPAKEIDHSKEPTSRNAVERAFEKLNISDDEPKTVKKEEAPAETTEKVAKADDKPADAKPDAKNEADTKNPNQSPAPDRFSPDAKVAWKDAPLAVRAEITRTITDLEGGIEKYRERLEPIEPFEKLAKENGVDLAKQMDSYVKIDQLLGKDFVGGLTEICKNKGVSLQDVAAHVLGQQSQPKTQENAMIQEMQSKIDKLTSELTGVTTGIKDEKTAEQTKQIDEFADSNPRFEELADDIALFLETGRADTLESAYKLAEMLTPAEAQTLEQKNKIALAQTQKDEKTAAQTRDRNLSLSGSPASGSNPSGRKSSTTATEAVNKAFAELGL